MQNLPFKIASTCAIIGLLGSGSVTSAQVSIPNKWDSEERTLIIDTNIPINCDQATFNARDTLASAEPAMNITLTFQSLPDPGPDSTSTITRASFGYGGAVTAGRTLSTRNGPSFFESYGDFIDGDIQVNHDLLFWPSTTDTEKAYDFWCDSAQGVMTNTQIDYQSMILHEMGHFVGFAHRTDASTGNCVMHPQQRRGVYNRVLCSDERSAYQAAY